MSITSPQSLQAGRATPGQAVGLLPRLVLPCFLISFVALMLRFAWTGFIASDDGYYVLSGLGWLNEFPYVAEHFGTVRAAVGIPMSLAIGLFGLSEWSVVFSTSLFLVGTAVMSYFALARHLPLVSAFWVSAGLATVPLLALKSTIPSADLPALFFIALAFWLFWWATLPPQRPAGLLLAAGVSIGLAFSAHEVTAALLFFFAPLFLFGYRLPRAAYLWMPAGFLAVVVGEMAYYAWAAGAPLHRWELLMGGTQVSDRVQVGFLQLGAGGTIHVWEPIDPLVMLFTKHDFGLVGWLAAPALWWAFVTRRQDSSDLLRLMRLLGGLAAVWIVFAAIALQNLILLPRYYMVAGYALYLCAALWITLAVWPERKRLAAGLAALGVCVNLLAIAVDNKDFRFGERALVHYLKTNPGVVVTDPMTAFSATWFCRWDGVDCARAEGRKPMPGDLYFHNPPSAARSNRFVRAEELAAFRPDTSWPVVWRQEGPDPFVAMLARRSGLAAVLPAQVAAKLARPAPLAVVYAVPPQASTPAGPQEGSR